MPKKPKFKPEITRVKLNPEQAVLSCNCYDQGYIWEGYQFCGQHTLNWCSGRSASLHHMCNKPAGYNPYVGRTYRSSSVSS